MVQLLGDASDLSALAKSLTGNDLNVSRDGQDYVLTSDRFQARETAADIHAKAKEIVANLNGACRYTLGTTRPLSVGAVLRRHPDGERDITIRPEPARIVVRALSPTVKVGSIDGSVEESNRADPVKHLMRLALSSDAVRDVLHLIATGTLDWVNLCRILEIVVEDVGGPKVIARHRWATLKSMELLERTANSYDAVGLKARHGRQRAGIQPPPKPMLISEARKLIGSIVHKWLESKM
jgi:hypothetical protein